LSQKLLIEYGVDHGAFDRGGTIGGPPEWSIASRGSMMFVALEFAAPGIDELECSAGLAPWVGCERKPGRGMNGLLATSFACQVKIALLIVFAN